MKKEPMKKILLSAVLLSLATPVWAETKPESKQNVPPPHMKITAEEFKEVQADVAAKSKENDSMLKKLNDQAKKTADCRLNAAKLVTPTNVQARIQECDNEARAVIEKLSPTTKASPTALVSTTTSPTGIYVSDTQPLAEGVSASMLFLPPVTSPSIPASPTGK